MRRAQTDRLVNAALVVVVLTVSQKVSGFLREQAVAVTLGITPLADAFLLGTVWSDTISFTAATAITAAMVPEFTRSSSNGSLAVQRLARRAGWRVALICGALAAVAGLMTPVWLMPFTRGWSADLVAIAVQCSRYSLVQIPLFAMAAVYRAALNTLGSYAYGPLGVTIQNLINAVLAFIFGGVSVVALARWQLLGFALPVAVAWIKLYVKWAGSEDVPRSTIPVGRWAGTAVVPLLLWSSMGYSYVLIERFYAPTMPAGSVAALTYADRLRQVALQSVTLGVVTVIYPKLAATAETADWRSFRNLLGKGVHLALLGSFPAAVGLAVLRHQVVGIVFQRGNFDFMATSRTAEVLLGYAVGLPMVVMGSYLAHALFALGHPWGAVLTVAVGVTIHTAVAKPLVAAVGAAGVTWAGAAGSLATVLTQTVYLLWRRPDLVSQVPSKWVRGATPYTVANLVLLTTAWSLASGITTGQSSVGNMVTVGGIILASATAYLGSLWVLGVPEARQLGCWIIQMWRRTASKLVIPK